MKYTLAKTLNNFLQTPHGSDNKSDVIYDCKPNLESFQELRIEIYQK